MDNNTKQQVLAALEAVRNSIAESATAKSATTEEHDLLNRFEELETRIDKLESQLESRIDDLWSRIDELESRIEDIEHQTDDSLEASVRDIVRDLLNNASVKISV